MASELTIGKIAKQAGVHVETIRYYQRRGLLSEPEKPHRGYRQYPAVVIEHIRFIKRAQALGFTLNNIAVLLRELEGDRPCGTTRRLTLDKIKAIERKIAYLKSVRKALVTLVRRCDPEESTKGCSIILACCADEYQPPYQPESLAELTPR